MESPSCLLFLYRRPKFTHSTGGRKGANWYNVHVDVIPLLEKWECQLPDNFFACSDVRWALGELELGVSAFVHVEGMHISIVYFTDLVELQYLPWPSYWECSA